MHLQEPTAISEAELPLTLPDTDDFKPSGTPDPPLAKCALLPCACACHAPAPLRVPAWPAGCPSLVAWCAGSSWLGRQLAGCLLMRSVSPAGCILMRSASPSPPTRRCTDWVATTDPHGRPARRETSTMPQWAGSCWYYLRYIDPTNDARCGRMLACGGRCMHWA